MKALKFLCLILLFIGLSIFICLAYNPASDSWKLFMQISRGVKWVLIPLLIIYLNRIIEYFLRKHLSPKERSMLLQCQLAMGFVFVLIETTRYLWGPKW